jgi:hypothetical protein
VTKVKNVRAGIVIIADAGLKLAPGETVSVDKLTAQMNSALDAGLLARVDGEGEGKSKPKSTPKPEEKQQEPIKEGQPALPSQGAEVASGAAATEESKETGAPAEAASGAKRAGK